MAFKTLKGEDAIDTLADIMIPLAAIISDEEAKKRWSDGHTTVLQLVQFLLKQHKKEIVQIMARLDGVAPEDYECDILTLPKSIVAILNDEDIRSLFTSLVASTASSASGSATGNITATEAM